MNFNDVEWKCPKQISSFSLSARKNVAAHEIKKTMKLYSDQPGLQALSCLLDGAGVYRSFITGFSQASHIICCF